MEDIRVFIFDDNHRIRESLSLLFESTDGFELCGAQADCSRMFEYIENTAPDIVLMDIDMPGITGIEAVRVLKEKYPDLLIMMLTVFDDDQRIFDAICAGANGYMLKNRSLSNLLDAVKEMHAGGSPMTPSIARRVLQLMQQANKPAANKFDLSERELQVLNELVKGSSYKMIADSLNIAYDTVSNHIKVIYKKLQVNSKSEAVAKAIKNRLAGMIL